MALFVGRHFRGRHFRIAVWGRCWDYSGDVALPYRDALLSTVNGQLLDAVLVGRHFRLAI